MYQNIQKHYENLSVPFFWNRLWIITSNNSRFLTLPQTLQCSMWDLSVCEIPTVAQIQSSYKEIIPPASRRYQAIVTLFLAENSWPQWPREKRNQALRKGDEICSLAPPSLLCGSWPIVQTHHLLFALNFRSKLSSHHWPLPDPFVLYNNYNFLRWLLFSNSIVSEAVIVAVMFQTFVLTLLMKLKNYGSCILMACWPRLGPGRRIMHLYIKVTDFFIRTLSDDRFGGSQGSFCASANLPPEPNVNI